MNIIIDGLQYCNWNRKILEDLWQGGLTAVHVTIVYWENTEEAIKKIKKWQIRIKKNKDIITHAKNTDDIIKAKKNTRLNRAIMRSNLSLNQIEKRMTIQQSNINKEKLSDFIIENNNSIEEFHQELDIVCDKLKI